jgi:multicomponent Na+:H+ antiporter subunit F
VSGFLLGFTLAVATLIAVGLHRVWAGPTVFDRLVAIALLTVNGVIVIVLLGFLLDRPTFYLDIALAYALLAFVLPIAVGRYFEQRPQPHDPDAVVVDPDAAVDDPDAGVDEPGAVTDGEARP